MIYYILKTATAGDLNLGLEFKSILEIRDEFGKGSDH